MNFIATKTHVYNRGTPPDDFLSVLVATIRAMPDEVFMPNERFDIYSSVRPQLGPWNGLLHRKAVMCEVLRVLAGFESTWHWNEGVDTTNAASVTHLEGQETGIFQVSYDSMALASELKDYVAKALGAPVPVGLFIEMMKNDHPLAIEYCARLLRFSIAWDGPIKRGEIHPWLSRNAVAEFERLLS